MYLFCFNFAWPPLALYRRMPRWRPFRCVPRGRPDTAAARNFTRSFFARENLFHKIHFSRNLQARWRHDGLRGGESDAQQVWQAGWRGLLRWTAAVHHRHGSHQRRGGRLLSMETDRRRWIKHVTARSFESKPLAIATTQVALSVAAT